MGIWGSSPQIPEPGHGKSLGSGCGAVNLTIDYLICHELIKKTHIIYILLILIADARYTLREMWTIKI
jgi:hypothetical protein